MSQYNIPSSGGNVGTVETITGNSGGAVAPTAGNINLLAVDTNTVIGNPGTSTLTITPTSAGYPITPYVVGMVGQAGYQTIQSAINAASLAGGGLVFIQRGSYNENLTMASDVFLMGVDPYSTEIVGTHNLPSSTTGFTNIRFTSNDNCFTTNSSAGPNTYFTNCLFTVINGYSFILPNWTGTIYFTDSACDQVGTDDGFVNGSPNMVINSCTIGAGSANHMKTNNSILLFNSQVLCGWEMNDGTNLQSYSTNFTQNITTFSGAFGQFFNCSFSTGGAEAFTIASGSEIDVYNSNISSSANPVISGSGDSAIQGVNFTNISNIDANLGPGTATTGVFVATSFLGYRPIVTQSGGSYILALSDANTYQLSTNAGATTVTVPLNSSVPFVVGTEIDVYQQGTGQITFAAAGGVTLNSAFGNLKIATQFAGASLKKTATNTWELVGNLIA